MAAPIQRLFSALFLGALGFALVAFVMVPGQWLYAGVAAVAGLVVGLALPGSKKVSYTRIGSAGKPRPVGDLITDGVERADYEASLKIATAQQRKVNDLAFSITNPTVKVKVTAIAAGIEAILKDLRENPDDFRAARQFLDYYLEAMVKVIRRYVELSPAAATDPEVRKSLDAVEESLDAMEAACHKQLKILQENDKLDLDVELKVLKKTIELEHLGS